MEIQVGTDLFGDGTDLLGDDFRILLESTQSGLVRSMSCVLGRDDSQYFGHDVGGGFACLCLTFNFRSKFGDRRCLLEGLSLM